jgi:hypothetical protein
MSDLLEWAKLQDGDLDREIEALKNLAAARPPREESSSLTEEPTWGVIGEGTGSRKTGLHASVTLSGGIHGTGNRDALASDTRDFLVSDRKFVLVDDLPLEDENYDPREGGDRGAWRKDAESNMVGTSILLTSWTRGLTAPFLVTLETLREHWGELTSQFMRRLSLGVGTTL